MIVEALKKVQQRADLTAAEAEQVFGEIMGCDGAVDPVRIAALLTAIQMKGPAVAEVIGAAKAMRAAGVHVKAPADAVDIVGTGGDGFGTFNVSTTAALIAAGAGVTIAKHGNRASTSKSGAADCLAALGYNLEASVETVEKSIAEVGIGFLFANKMHPAMRFAAPVRKALPFRTIFNLLGPLTNPAGATRCALGVYDQSIIPLYVGALKALGTKKALVFCGPDGLDELGLAGISHLAVLSDDGTVEESVFDPKSIFGDYAPIEAIAGGTPEENAAMTRGILDGSRRDARRRAAVLNAAAAIVAGGRASTLDEGVELAGLAIDSGAAMGKLEAMIEVCR